MARQWFTIGELRAAGVPQRALALVNLRDLDWTRAQIIRLGLWRPVVEAPAHGAPGT